MKKLFWITGICILLIACSSREKTKEDGSVVRAASDLPAINLQLVDGNTIDLRSVNQPTVLVMFQPDCDHCQREAVQIRENLEAFRAYNVYFISSATPSEVTEFADKYELSGKDRVWFGTTGVEDVLNNFGPIPAPSVFIYDEDGRLVREVTGEVDISLIVGYL